MQEDTPQTIRQKFDAAKQAQPAWAARSYDERAACLLNFKVKLEENCDELAKLLTEEMGKPIRQARGEIKGTLSRIDFFVEHGKDITADQWVNKDCPVGEKISHEPLGVVANISAWNYPYFVGSNVFVPALLTGNAVLFKPSEFTLKSGLRMTELMHEAGVPKEIFVPILGAGEAGAALCDLPINGMFFTGSYATGAKIAAKVGPRMIKMQLELGGKDPAYVCEDVDIDKAAESTLDGVIFNAGQSCCSVERLYVHQDIHDDFLKALVTKAKAAKMGDPLEKDTYVGRLAQPGHGKFLAAQVEDAVQKGATLECGGKEREGNFFEPTVLSQANHTMSVMRDESFGPIIGVQKVRDDKEALELMNDTEYGLTASVFTKNKERALGLMSKLESGTVYWNCCDRVSSYLPWTGVKHSGLGSTASFEGIRTFTRPKAWHLKD